VDAAFWIRKLVLTLWPGLTERLIGSGEVVRLMPSAARAVVRSINVKENKAINSNNALLITLMLLSILQEPGSLCK
jgi:hypothetical protein